MPLRAIAKSLFTARFLQSRALPVRASRQEKWSGERSRISWAYYPKQVLTNEISRSVIITQHFPCNSKMCSSVFKHPYLFRAGWLQNVLIQVTLSQKCALALEIQLGSPDHFSSREGGVWVRNSVFSAAGSMGMTPMQLLCQHSRAGVDPGPHAGNIIDFTSKPTQFPKLSDYPFYTIVTICTCKK